MGSIHSRPWLKPFGDTDLSYYTCCWVSVLCSRHFDCIGCDCHHESLTPWQSLFPKKNSFVPNCSFIMNHSIRVIQIKMNCLGLAVWEPHSLSGITCNGLALVHVIVRHQNICRTCSIILEESEHIWQLAGAWVSHIQLRGPVCTCCEGNLFIYADPLLFGASSSAIWQPTSVCYFPRV